MGANRRRAAILLMVGLVVTATTQALPTAVAHPVSSISIRSICHYEESYFVWSKGDPWKVYGRLKPSHGNRRVVLQKSKYGRNWRKWKVDRTNSRGRYLFRGNAPWKKSWWVNLRVVMPAQAGHNRKVSSSIYVDTNPYTTCG